MNDVNNTENQPKPKGNGLLVTLGVLIILALAAAGAYMYWNQDATQPNGEDNGSAVAIVNGKEISQAEYDRSVTQIESAYTAQGVDISDANASASVRDQALSTLVNRMLINEAAVEAGITVDDGEVETEVQNTLTTIGGEEGLATVLAQSGMSEDEFRADLRTDILINKYLEMELGVSSLTVSEEEIETAYNTASAEAVDTEEIPPLEEVRELISDQLLAEKQQQVINTELERLRQEAEIEILI